MAELLQVALLPWARVLRTLAENQNGMQVVWHHDEGVEFRTRDVVGDLQPTVPGDPAYGCQVDVSILDRAEHAAAGSHADRHEVSRG